MPIMRNFSTLFFRRPVPPKLDDITSFFQLLWPTHSSRSRNTHPAFLVSHFFWMIKETEISVYVSSALMILKCLKVWKIKVLSPNLYNIALSLAPGIDRAVKTWSVDSHSALTISCLMSNGTVGEPIGIRSRAAQLTGVRTYRFPEDIEKKIRRNAKGPDWTDRAGHKPVSIFEILSGYIKE